MFRPAWPVLIVGWLIGVPPFSSAEARAQTTYRITPLGLTGPVYGDPSGRPIPFSVIQGTTNTGQAMGWTYRAGSNGLNNGIDAWAASRGVTTPIGLTGVGYSYASGYGGVVEHNTPFYLNATGQVGGFSERYASNGTDLGTDAWFFDGATTRQIGLTGPGYQNPRADPAYTYQLSTLSGFNDSGQCLGVSLRYLDTFTALGQDAWLFTGGTTRSIGLTGPDYGYTRAGYGGVGSGTYRYSTVSQLNAAGQATGTTSRFDALGNTLGTDVWVHDANNGTTRGIGLTGAGYGFAGIAGGTYRTNFVTQLNNAGQVAGATERYTDSGTAVGQDTWFFDGAVTRQVGLTGPAYSIPSAGGTSQFSVVQLLNDAGQLAGFTGRYSTAGSYLGQDVWFASNQGTRQIGLTGPTYGYATDGGNYQNSSALFMSRSGQVVGSTNRYSANGTFLGKDAWYFDNGATRAMGLTGTNYGYSTPAGLTQISVVTQLGDSGKAAGYSNRYGPGATVLGQDAWFYDGSLTAPIGLAGAAYSYSNSATAGGLYQSGMPLRINDHGQVTGTATRFDASGTQEGQAGWFFDPRTGTTTPLVFSVNTASGYSFTNPTVLTPSGIVLGFYTLFDGGTNEGNQPFYWSESAGFHDLSSVIDGGLSANGWQSLVQTYGSVVPGPDAVTSDGSPLYILGAGRVLGDPNIGDPFYMVAVPEPSALALLPVGLLLARRRTRRCR